MKVSTWGAQVSPQVLCNGDVEEPEQGSAVLKEASALGPPLDSRI